MKFIFVYIVFTNILLFTLMAIDKQKAKLRQWRISEKTLFILALIGGSIGGILGMYTFRHKTQKPQFVIGFPVILICEIILFIYIWIKYF